MNPLDSVLNVVLGLTLVSLTVASKHLQLCSDVRIRHDVLAQASENILEDFTNVACWVLPEDEMSRDNNRTETENFESKAIRVLLNQVAVLTKRYETLESSLAYLERRLINHHPPQHKRTNNKRKRRARARW